MKINRTERNYLRPLIVFNALIERRFSGVWALNGESDQPVRVNALCETLIRKGLLERVLGDLIRPTSLARTFSCLKCHQGEHFDDSGDFTHKCNLCDGLGIVLNNESSINHQHITDN